REITLLWFTFSLFVRFSYQCQLLVQIRQKQDDLTENGLQVTLCSTEVKEGSWYGFAFSEDSSMGDDFLVHCDVFLNGSLSIGEGLTTGHSGIASLDPGTLILSKPESLVSNVTFNGSSISLVNKRLECSWNLKISGEARGRIFNLKLNKYHLILAFGRLTKDGAVEYHNGARSASSNLVNLFHTGLITGCTGSIYWLVRFHAFFMTVAWMMFISISITMARNYRDAWTYVRFFNLHIWLITHRTLNIIAVTLVAIGMTCIIIHTGTFDMCASCHTTAGTIANGLMICQIVAGLTSPSNERTRLRKMFNIFHGLGGHITFIAACVALYKAGDQKYFRLGLTYNWLIILFIVIHYAVQVILQSSQMLIKSLNAVQDISITSQPGHLTPISIKESNANSTSMLYDYVQDKIDRFKFNTLLYYIPTIILLTITTFIVAMITGQTVN
ncbi:ferric-chelate reductase 1-like, partial [Panonychus citri]|uniref:ferric-chelate reductase 1-like n=1 Tax=Panonychus citri TaxID=50023 RepID=UPI002307A137